MTRSAGPRPVPSDLPPTLQPMAITHAAPRTDKRVAMLGAMAIYGCMPLAMMAMGKFMPKLPPLPPARTEPVGPIVDLGTPDLLPPGPLAIAPGPAYITPALPDDHAAQDRTNPDDVSEIPDKLDIQPQSAHSTGDPTGQTNNLVGPNPPIGPVGPPRIGDSHSTGTANVVDFSATGLQVLKQVDPIYPPVARASHTQGSVVLRMVVDERGYPTKADVIEGPPLLRAEALRAAHQWQFVPARVGGQPVAATFLLTLKFRLI